MSIASVAAAVVAGQQSQIRTDIAAAITKQQIQAQRDFVAQVAKIADQIQAAAPEGAGRVVDTRA